MQRFFKCDYCDYTSDGDTVGDKMDMEEHEDKCKHNPKNEKKPIQINLSIPHSELKPIHKKLVDGYIIMKLLSAGIPAKGAYILEGVTRGKLERYTKADAELFIWTNTESTQIDGGADCVDLKGDNT
jgi:hypothetical protein